MSTKHGTMATDRPERYAKQLGSHWAAKAEVSEDDGETRIEMSAGQVALLRPAAGTLGIEVSVPDDGEADVDRWAEVVAAHLQRFGQRDELDVVWD